MASKPAFDEIRRKELWEMQPIYTKLPIKFKNNKNFCKFNGICAICNVQIEDDLLHGQITMPIDDTAVVHAVGYCKSCHTLTCFHYRMHSDVSMSGIVNGQWKRWLPTKIDKKDRMKDHFLYGVKMLMAGYFKIF